MKKYLITDYNVKADIEKLQTKEIQAVLDMCREEGGIVVIPKGCFRVSSLRMWSDTTLYLESGAYLKGSDICEDYEIFDVPENVEMRSDMELLASYYEKKPWKEYRRAMISVYGGKNISIIGEPDSCIDGDDCADPNGEEGYRGPHGIYLTNVVNVNLSGYTIKNCGNFMHQMDNCKNITAKNVSCIGGSDGMHMHFGKNILIEDCIFHTGDDCVAGVNIENITVRRCDLNTSCNVFRIGGTHVLIEDCHIWGPGIYPHRMTVVQNRGTEAVRSKANALPREAGRHNAYTVYLHFASSTFPNGEPYHDVVFKNCTVDYVDNFLRYFSDEEPLQNGTHLVEMRLENVSFKNLETPSIVTASAEEPLMVYLKNVSVHFRNEVPCEKLFDGTDPNTIVKEIS